MKKLIFITLLALSLGLNASTSAAPTNKVLQLGMSQEFENLNPLIKQMLATTYIYAMVGRTMVTINADGQWIPQLIVESPSLEKGSARKFKEKGT